MALIHTIGRSEPPTATNPFIAKYIFPGGYIPALSEMAAAIERSGLIIADLEILRLHYAETLRAWRQRFLANWDKAAAIHDETFCRMWEFYLAASETAFRYQNLVVFQVQLAKRIEALPITRDYMYKAERVILEHEGGAPPHGRRVICLRLRRRHRLGRANRRSVLRRSHCEACNTLRYSPRAPNRVGAAEDRPSVPTQCAPRLRGD